MKKEINKKHVVTIAFYIILVCIITLGYVIKYYNSKKDITMEDIMVEDDSIWLPEPSGSTPTPTPCPAGMHGSPGSCEQCAAGTWSSAGSSSCTGCGAGKWSSAGSSSCSNISAGCYGTSASSKCPNKCAAGSYSSAGSGSCTQCTGQHYQPLEGQNNCNLTCFGDTDGKKCDECKITSLTRLSTSTNCHEPGTSVTLSAKDNGHCSRYTIKYSPAKTFSTQESCAPMEAKAYASGDGGSTEKKINIQQKASWKYVGTVVTTSRLNPRYNANYSCANVYGNCTPHEVPGYYKCTDVHVRCGGNPGAVPHYNFCCMDREYIGLSERLFYREYWPKKECSNPEIYKYLIEQTNDNKNIVNKDTCVMHDIPNYCTPTIEESAEALETDYCEQSKSIVLNSKDSSCLDGTKSFYSIKCMREVGAGFDYGADNETNTSRVLYYGQGYKFNVNTKTTVKCEAVFNDNNWNDTFDHWVDKINFIDYSGKLTAALKKGGEQGKKEWENRADAMQNADSLSGDTHREIYSIWNTVEELRNVVRAYNKFTPPNDYEENVDLILRYKLKKEENEADYNYTFDKKEKKGTYIIEKASGTQPKLNDTGVFSSHCYSGTITELRENCFPINYTISNYSDPREVVLFPQKTMIEKDTGETADDKATTETIDGGNRIYTDNNIDLGTWGMKIRLTGLAAGSTIDNNKCDITIAEQEVKYRPIDVTNPFINSDWKKGENWINDKYNFISIIHATTWSEPAQKSITLAKDDIQAIKDSNNYYQSNKDDPYLGICNGSKETEYDSITERICDQIK